MNFRNWSDMGNFPGVREFTSSHAFIKEFGQPFWHNATSYFQKLGWNVIRSDAIGNPERHMRKASHCGSKQQ